MPFRSILTDADVAAFDAAWKLYRLDNSSDEAWAVFDRLAMKAIGRLIKRSPSLQECIRDLAHDGILRWILALRRRDRGAEIRRPARFFVTIIRRTFLDESRREGLRVETSSIDEIEDEAFFLDREAEQEDLKALLESLITEAGLADIEGQVAHLVLIDHLSRADVALRIYGTDDDHATARIRRAFNRALRKIVATALAKARRGWFDETNANRRVQA